MQNPKKNASACTDLTAYEAIRSTAAADKRINQLISTLRYIARNAGFEIQGRIVLRDAETGREYR